MEKKLWGDKTADFKDFKALQQALKSFTFSKRNKNIIMPAPAFWKKNFQYYFMYMINFPSYESN